MSNDGERAGADFVEIVFGCMPVTVVYKVSDDIDGGNAAAHERIMVVFGGGLLIPKKGRIAQLISGVPHEVDQSRCGTGFAREISLAAANDVRQKKCSDLLEVAAGSKLSGHLTAAITAIGIAPLPHCFFAVEESNPHGVSSMLRAQEARELQHQGSGGTSVIRAHKIGLQQSVVVRAEKNHAGLFAGNLDKKVFHREAADGCVRSERVGLRGAPVAFQFGLQKILELGDRR